MKNAADGERSSPPQPDVMDAAETADFLRFSPAHIKILAEAGDVPAWKIRSSWRFSRSALRQRLGDTTLVSGSSTSAANSR